MRRGSRMEWHVEDLSDNEREEQLRRWWSDNWLWIVGGVAATGLLGLIAVADEPKATSAAGIAELRRLGLRPIDLQEAPRALDSAGLDAKEAQLLEEREVCLDVVDDELRADTLRTRARARVGRTPTRQAGVRWLEDPRVSHGTAPRGALHCAP